MTVDDHPKGYPQLAAFINSDDNFLIARKYGFLRSRVLLYRQDELSVLEKELIALDDDDKVNRALALTSRKHDEETDKDPVYSRKVLMKKIDDKLKEYGKHLKLFPSAIQTCTGLNARTDDLVSRIQTYVSLKAPSARNVKSFMDWIQDHKPLVQGELTFRKHKDDFVALADGQECGWLDGVVEDTMSWCLPGEIMKVRPHTDCPSGRRTLFLNLG